MFNQLAKPYITDANETIYIKASRSTVNNKQHCKGLCPSSVARHQLSKENTRFLRRTGMFADHRGTNGPPTEGHFQRTALRYLYQLPQNKLGISCQDSGGKLRPTSKLGKKRSRHPDPIPMLRVLRIFLWDCGHRGLEAVAHPSLHFQPLQDWQRTKPFGNPGHVPVTQTHPCLIGGQRPNSTPLCDRWHSKGQRRCNGYELQVRIGIL